MPTQSGGPPTRAAAERYSCVSPSHLLLLHFSHNGTTGSDSQLVGYAA